MREFARFEQDHHIRPAGEMVSIRPARARCDRARRPDRAAPPIRMPEDTTSRLRLGLAACRDHGFENLHVAGAAAEISGEALANLGVGRLGMARQQIRRPRESFPACRFRTARRRARETPAARASRRSPCATPSIVRIFAPSACTAGTRQLFTSAPSISTAHAPHSPSPQPSLVPVRPSSSRSTSSRRAIGYASKAAALPLTSHCTRTLRPRLQACTVSIISASTSGVTGIRRMSIPVASAIAFAIAGAVPSSGSSPIPLAPAGPCA